MPSRFVTGILGSIDCFLRKFCVRWSKSHYSEEGHMTLGEKIRESRRKCGLSQEQLAEKLSVSRSAIAKWETDKGLPDVGNLKILARLLNVSVDHLLDETLMWRASHWSIPFRTTAFVSAGGVLSNATMRSGNKRGGYPRFFYSAILICLRKQLMAAAFVPRSRPIYRIAAVPLRNRRLPERGRFWFQAPSFAVPAPDNPC